MTAAGLVRQDIPMPGLRLLRWSLVAVWLAAAATSALDAGGQASTLMAQAGLRGPLLGPLAFWGGVGGDVVLGALLAWRPNRAVLAAAIAWTLLMSAVATALVPGRWLDPLGPLVKNLPVLAALVLLRRHAP